MGNTLGIPQVASMGLAGDWSLGIPWHGSMVMHWESMDLHWGSSCGVPWKCSMAMPLGCPHGSPMDLHWQLLHRSTLEDALWIINREITMWLLWHWMWIDHWEFH